METQPAPKKKNSFIKIFLIGSIAFFIIVILLPKDGAKSSADTDQEEAAEALKDTLLNIQVFSEMSIEKNLKDPDSFEVIEHREYKVSDATPDMVYQSSLKYRAKNSFGGFVIEKRCFNFDGAGNMTKSFECE